MSSVTISKTDKFTFINVFTLHDPANQEKLINIMSAMMSGPGKSVPGFISAALHRSLDGTKVVVYSKWTSKEAGESLKDIVELRPLAMQWMEIASLTPVIYEVADTFFGPDYKE